MDNLSMSFFGRRRKRGFSAVSFCVNHNTTPHSPTL
jgi:hypothetical protein